MGLVFNINEMEKKTAKTHIYSNIIDLIGNTPLLRVEGVFAKLESMNPTGSIKDRMAYYMIKKAEQMGNLKPGDKIIEVTSGNTGIAFAMLSALRGYKFIAIMPESMSFERRQMMKIYGAKIILTPAEKDMKGAVEEYEKLIKKEPKAWLPKQFENPDNIAAHREGIGKEILEQMRGKKIDAFVAGVGTGGTLLGVAQALKRINPQTKIIAVEPKESAVLSGGKPGLHQIQGIGEGFIPKIVENNLNFIDEVVTISSQDAIHAMQNLAEKFGILAGISSGANILTAQKIKNKYGFKNVVTVLPDRGERYLSKNIC